MHTAHACACKAYYRGRLLPRVYFFYQSHGSIFCHCFSFRQTPDTPILYLVTTMGNCRSSPALVPLQVQVVLPRSKPREEDDCAAATLIRALLPLVLPIVRQVASQQCIAEKMVLLNEVQVVEQEESLKEEHFPIGPIEFHLESVQVLDYTTLATDMQNMPEFAWPETERLKTLMQSTPDRGMVALDILGVRMRLRLAPGIEFTVPVDGPMGITATLEIGTGGTIQEAWFQVEIPKLRVWFVTDTRQLYVAFMARPIILPRVHVNVDRGKGDFWEMEFTGEGAGLDDVVESLLCGFGPSSLTTKKEENNSKTQAKEKRSWVADALGQTIGSFVGLGDDNPLVIDLNEAVQSSIDSALGKARPVEAIRADIESLEKELALAEKAKKNQTEEEEEKEGTARGLVVQDTSENDASPSVLFCGLGV